MSALQKLFSRVGAERIADMRQDRQHSQTQHQQENALFGRDQRMWGDEDSLRRQQLRAGGDLMRDDRRGFGGMAMGFAEGGLVDPMSDPMMMDEMLGMGQMDMGGGQPMGALDMAMGGGGDPMMGGGDPMMEAYEAYVQSAEQMGLPPIPFEEFVGMLTDQMAMGEGDPMMGGDPDVSGQMVVDPDPNAPQDSIPATIDGQHPARLDSGEFVIPANAVMFHGIDKLKKLIAQAEQAEQI